MKYYHNKYRVESIRLKGWDYSTPWWYYVTDYFVVMPNHLHGMVVITEHTVEPCRGMALHNEFGKPIKNSLSMIINHYKGAVTHLCKENKLTGFAWQPKFYDWIIRNERELYAIRKYIAENPIKWDVEKNVPDNLEL